MTTIALLLMLSVFSEVGQAPASVVHKGQDGEFTVLAADWKAGRLEFRANYGRGADCVIADCVMTFKRHGSMLFLEDLRAVLSKAPRPGRPKNEELVDVEYRVPAYSEIRMIPVEFVGLVNVLDKDKLDMEQTLNESDRAIWLANKGDVPIVSHDRALPGWRETLRREKRPISADEVQIIRNFYCAELREWLAIKGLSPEGRDKIVAVYAKHMLPDF